MNKLTFTVNAIWDEDAQVFYSESDIIGLHIEAEDIEKFEAIMHEQARDLVIANHMSKRDLSQKSLFELIPTIFWQRPASDMAAA